MGAFRSRYPVRRWVVHAIGVTLAVLAIAIMGIPASIYILRTMFPVYALIQERKEMSARGLFMELPGHPRWVIMLSLSSGVRQGTLLYRGKSFGRVYRMKPKPRPRRRSLAEALGLDQPLIGGTAWAR